MLFLTNSILIVYPRLPQLPLMLFKKVQITSTNTHSPMPLSFQLTTLPPEDRALLQTHHLTRLCRLGVSKWPFLSATSHLPRSGNTMTFSPYTGALRFSTAYPNFLLTVELCCSSVPPRLEPRPSQRATLAQYSHQSFYK